jgi:peptidoglycan hydrolase CwlO-like protein
MKSTNKGLLILTGIIILGVWGCSQSRNEAANAKLRQLEAQHARLEEDYQAVAKANENFRKRLAQVEAQRADLAKQVAELRVVVRERDELRQQVTARTAERDTLHSQMVQFSRELVNLAGRVEAATTGTPRQVTVSFAD